MQMPKGSFMPDDIVNSANLWVVRVEAALWNVPMRAPYRSAQRVTTTARNVLVRVVLDDGSVGFGESAPATYVTGETQESVLARVQQAAPKLQGLSCFAALRQIAALEEAGGIKEPGARGALEMALWDAQARANATSLAQLLSNSHFLPNALSRGHALASAFQTDLSLPLLPPEEAHTRAAEADSDGYRAIKIKVGGPSYNDDLARVCAIAESAPQAKLRLDGNQGFAPEDAVRFIDDLSHIYLLPRIELLEQPTKAGDDDALFFVQKRVPIPVFADEAVHEPEDAFRLLARGACEGIVLKLAKSGVMQTLAIARTAQDLDGSLMFGCMMETRLAISAALQLSAAIGRENNISPRLDLDGHLLTKAGGMVSGGFTQTGDVLTFDLETPGLGVDVVWPPV